MSTTRPGAGETAEATHVSQAATETNPSTDQTDQDPALENPTTDPSGAADQDDTGDGGNDPDPRVQRANRQAAQYRTQLRETEGRVTELTQQVEQSNTLLENLRRAITGDTAEDTNTDPAEQVTELTSEVGNLRTENQRLRSELLVHELASDAGANPVALLDSRRFTDTVAALDASAEDYRDQVAKAITQAVESNQNLRAGQGSRRGGAETAGRTGDSTVTQEQFNAMSAKDRGQLFQTNPTLYRKLADGEIASKRG